MNASPLKHAILIVLVGLLLLAASAAEAQKVRVTEAVPAQAEQGVINLDVEISGSGFDPGSTATFLVAGNDTDTGGVHVRSNSFVNSKKIIANIDIEVGAVIGDYDIEVRTSSGRRGKGNTLFKVLQKGTAENGTGTEFDCELVDEFDPVYGALLSDGGGMYVDGQQKVGCYSGGETQPNLSRLRFETQVTTQPVKKAVRKFDLAFIGGCLPGNDCDVEPAVPEEFFVPGTPEVGIWGVTPYPEQGYLQHLIPGESYEVGAGIGVRGYPDSWAFRFRGRVVDPSDWGERACDMTLNPNFDAEDVVSEDVTLYVWDDGTGYTATTGTIVAPGSPPLVSPGTRLATLCSSAGPVDCEGGTCNLRGQVAVQFTLHARSQ